MKPSSKYYPLHTRLSQSGEKEIHLTFAEIEALIGETLPPSARFRRDWWGNRKEALQASAWMQAGYHVQEVDLPGQQVIFRKPVSQYTIRRAAGTVLWDADLVKGLRAYLGMNQKQMAEQLGVRQQTISEWENGLYEPSRAMCKYLSLVAEKAGFDYGEQET